MKPKLRFNASRIEEIASRYEYAIGEDDLVEFRPEVQVRGYLSKQELEKIAYWKTPRSFGRVRSNPEDYVQEITALALNAKGERVRIEVLILLDGGK